MYPGLWMIPLMVVNRYGVHEVSNVYLLKTRLMAFLSMGNVSGLSVRKSCLYIHIS